jgi:molecular chaperone GrpE (heat shock protein)
VPFIKRFNDLIALQQEAIRIEPEEDENGEALTSDLEAWVKARRDLKSAALAFKKDVEAADRRAKRRGGLTHAPRGTEDLLRSALPVLEDIRDSLQHLVDVQRYEVCTLSSR